MSWFLKYRPKKIKDLDLTDVRDSFLAMMKSGKIPQTMLFAGPKGTGKTSTSRIIGAMLNDPTNEENVESLFFGDQSKLKSFKEPNSKSDFAKRVHQGKSFVVQEMDAASNRGIDDIRQLKDRIALPPQEGKMAVYILDEVHMLTNQAFNALLKILEEPPEHVVFILATTELHKVPATIVSRCSTISFRKATIEEITKRLEKILKKEKIEYEAEALKQIAVRADGSFRDAVKMAELASQANKVTVDQLQAVIGGSAEIRVKALVESILAKDQSQVMKIFSDLRQENFDEDYFYQTFFSVLHRSLMRAFKVEKGEPFVNQAVAFFLLRELLKTDLSIVSPIAFLPMELALLEIIQRAQANDGGSSSGKKSIKKSDTNKKKLEKEEIGKENKSEKMDSFDESVSDLIKEKTTEKENKVSKIVKEDECVKLNEVNKNSLSQRICEEWTKLLQVVAEENLTLAALLRSGKPKSGPNGTAEVQVYYNFHLEQLRQPKYKKLIEECGSRLLGSQINFEFVLTNPPAKAELVEVPAKTKELETLAEEALM